MGPIVPLLDRLPAFSGSTLTLLIGQLLTKEFVMRVASKMFMLFLSLMGEFLVFCLSVIALTETSSESEDGVFFKDQKIGYGYNEAGEITYNGYPIDD